MFFQQEMDGVVDHAIHYGCDGKNSADNSNEFDEQHMPLSILGVL